MRVFLDPGHGGRDPGACHKQLKEKDLTLAIALRIRDQLAHQKDISIKLSRYVDETCSLSKRVRLAEDFSADLYVAIHINAGGGSGFESFRYLSTGPETVEIHQLFHQMIIKTLPVTDRGLKQGDFYVLRQTSMPALLTEALFIDHPRDYNALTRPAMIDRIARAHVEAIMCVKDKDKNKKRWVCGSFKSEARATKRQLALKTAGFNATVKNTQVKGSHFYRVIVSDNPLIEDTKEKLHALGYDTFLMH
jgi:N-acetylmuramoyl-L-alanine amidase